MKSATRPQIHIMGSIQSMWEFQTLGQCPELAISEDQDDPEIRARYRPFLLDPEVESRDWISELELGATISMVQKHLKETGSRLKVLVLYGSLRKRYSGLIPSCHILRKP